MVLLLFPAPSKSATEKGRKQEEYSEGVKDRIEDGKEINTEAYEKALKESGYSHTDAVNYWKDPSNADPYSYYTKEVSNIVSQQAPKVEISNGKVTISGTKDVLSSPYTQQIREELQALKGSNLDSAEVRNAIDALNGEIQTGLANAAIEQTLGWTADQYKDYQYAIQTISGNNPMSSSNKIKGYDKDKKIIMEKTPQEWVDYYRSVYNTDERTDAIYDSAKANNPYERTMYLVLTQGGDKAVYGFDYGEKVGQGLSAAWNQIKKFPEGTFRNIFEGNDTKTVEKFAKELNISKEALLDFSIVNEEKFNEKVESLKDKTWDKLSEKDKAFLLLLGASEEGTSNTEFSKEAFQQGQKRALNAMSMPNDYVSSDAINKILRNGNYEDYKKTRNGYSDWSGYEDYTNEDDLRLAKNALWSESQQKLGNIGGVISRFLWENAVFKGLTGGVSGNGNISTYMKNGFSMNNISDELGSIIVKGLNKVGISPTSTGGKNMLQFTANLAGTIPEDILQTAVDNVLTYNADENANLLNPNEMSENFKNNLIFMALFNAAKTGINSVRRARMAKELAKSADWNAELNIEGIASDADDVARAVKNADNIKVDGDKVVLVDAETGEETVLKNTTPEQVELVQRSLFNMDEDAPDGVAKANADLESPKIDTDGIETAKIETESPDTVKADTDFRPKNLDDALKAKVEPNEGAIRNWHSKTLDRVMKNFKKNLNTFHDRFGDVQVSDFDWVLYNTRKGLAPEQIVGTTDPTTGRVVTQNMIEAMGWWSEQPFVKDLRKASRETLGFDGDFDTLGYLPHTDYDPSNLDFDEALTGALWQKSTGKSMLDDAGEYKGYGGDFENRYRTFASNMLWDTKNPDIASARVVDEARMDGSNITPEEATEVTQGAKKINESVVESSSVKEFEKNMLSDSDDIDYKKIDADTQKDADKLGLGKATHDNWGKVYSKADTGVVTKQSGKFKQGFDTLGNTMRNTEIAYTEKGKTVKLNMYDAGGADLVYAKRSAIDLVNRFTETGKTWGELKDMFVEYIVNHSKRSPEFAEEIADRWIAKLADEKGPLTKATAVKSIGNSMKWEAYSRLRRFLAIAKYDDFNASTKKMIDRFLFRHMQTDTITNSPKIIKKAGKSLDAITGLRYRALFYGNLKNALLQTTELNRYFSAFKWGDVAKMTKRMATDDAFRARVDDYVDAVAPMTKRLRAEIYQAYSDVNDSVEVTKDGVTFKSLGNKAKDIADTIGLAPIEAAESFKNRMMVAALVQEADSLGLTGDEALRHIRNRFERVALAMDEMGQLGFASNPIGRTALFLQNFQIRELGMHWYNIKDLTGMASSTPKKVLAAANYLTKVFGAKMATTLIMARLGYSASQTLGLDPFGLLDSYNDLDEEDMEGWDYFFKSPLFAGGMTSLIADIYFMSRRAYEDSNPQTLAEEAEERYTGGSSYGLALPSFDELMGFGESFIPGSTFAKRINQMNDMMSSGWATSASGNKMYTAPDDPVNILLGYLFGRSATQNAQQYNQTYGDNLAQTIGRFNPFRQYGEFDPIDTVNYTDWFKGDGNDTQQFNKGIRYFKQQKNNILDTYESVIRDSYAQDDEIAEAKNDMENKLNDLFNQLEKFVGAYENKNGTINAAMTKQIINVLNTGRAVVNETSAEKNARELEDYNKALERYSNLGMSAVGTYSGPNKYNENAEVKYQGSPQWRAAKSAKYSLQDEAVNVLKQADADLKELRDNLKNRLSNAYDVEDYDEVTRIQKEYLDEFDDVVSPIIALYGSSVLDSTDVVDQIRDMLSTGTNSRSGNLIPSDQYKKDKYGRYRSMPLETVDVKKWLKQRFSNDIYNQPTVRSNSTAEEDLAEIKNLASKNKMARARARALQLFVRVENHQRALNDTDYEWLKNFINEGAK